MLYQNAGALLCIFDGKATAFDKKRQNHFTFQRADGTLRLNKRVLIEFPVPFINKSKRSNLVKNTKKYYIPLAH